MKKSYKKREWNDEGQSTGFQIIILIIIALLVWEFGAGYLGISPLTSYLGLSEETPTGNIYLEFELYNIIKEYEPDTNQVLLDVDNDPRNEHEDIPVFPISVAGWIIGNHTYDVDNYEIRISTNAPYRSFLPYRIKVTTHEVNTIHKVETTIRYYEPVTEDGYIILEPNNAWITVWDLGQPQKYTIFEVDLISPFSQTIESISKAVIDRNHIW